MQQGGDYDPNPTCGFYWVGAAKVPDSQGFTCECSAGQVWDTTLSGGSYQRT